MKIYSNKELSTMKADELVEQVKKLQSVVTKSLSTSNILKHIMEEEELSTKEIKDRLESDFNRELAYSSQIYSVAQKYGLKIHKPEKEIDSKSKQIISLIKEGSLTRKEIAEKLGTNYSYVVQTIAKNKEELAPFINKQVEETVSTPKEEPSKPKTK